MTEEPKNWLAEALKAVLKPRTPHVLVESSGPQPLHIVALPNDMQCEDLTDQYLTGMTRLKPLRRWGTATLADLPSLIAWANRYKGDTSVIFAQTGEQPALTCIADYLAGGAPVMDAALREDSASYCRHRAVYKFPMSKAWAAWTKIYGKTLTKAELGDFIEERATDMIMATPFLTGAKKEPDTDWETHMMKIAASVRGSFGNPDTLISLSRRFEINEKSNISSIRNPDTGEVTFNFTNEHQAPDGSPIKIPNLFVIAIPVFENGPLYRLAARFRYQKSGGDVRFSLSIHNAAAAFDDAVKAAIAEAQAGTGLPVLIGTPEQ